MKSLIYRNIMVCQNIICLSVLAIAFSYLFLNLANFNSNIISGILSGTTNHYQNIFLMSISFSVSIIFLLNAINLKKNNKNYMIYLRITKFKVNLCVFISLIIIDVILLILLSLIIDFNFLLVLLIKLLLQLFCIITSNLFCEILFLSFLFIDYIFNSKSIIFNVFQYNSNVLIIVYIILILLMMLFILLKKDRRKIE